MYSGPTAAHTYHQVLRYRDPLATIVLLGPSHRAALQPPVQATPYANWQTPLGTLPVDGGLADRLGLARLAAAVDVAEHSLEMQMPLLRHVLNRRAQAGIRETVRIVPLLVAAPAPALLEQLATQLAALLADTATLLVVSSDFCHWGTSFAYTPRLLGDDPTVPLHSRIRALDQAGLAAIEAGPAAFRAYLDRTRNTICGREPLAIALHVVARLGTAGQWAWLAYAQSQALPQPSSTASQVSYVAGAYLV